VTLLAAGETLAQVQQPLLESANSAPMYAAMPGHAAPGFRIGAPLGQRTDLFADFYNLTDCNCRGMGWGIEPLGRGVKLQLRHRL
jgi:hypothetical protein